jgi:hypothetical protein
LALLDEHDRHQDAGEHQPDQHHGDHARLGPDGAEVGRQLADDRGEDQQRHAVADAPLRHQLAHPHDQGGAGGQADHHDQHPAPVVLTAEQVDVAERVAAGEALATVLEQEGEARRLHDGDGHGEVPRPLRDLALADRALLLPLLQLRDHHGQDLHDDRGRDVGHHAQGEHGELRDGAPGEEAQELEGTGLPGVVLERLQRRDVDPRHRHVRAEPVQQDHEHGEGDLVAEILHLEHVLHAREHGDFLSGQRSRW